MNNPKIVEKLRKFDFITIVVRDPIDLKLPDVVGQVVLEDSYSGSDLLIDPKRVGEAYAKDVRVNMNKIKGQIKKAGSDYLFLETNKPFVKEVSKFFNRRSAEWR